jgi:hypothetical protein
MGSKDWLGVRSRQWLVEMLANAPHFQFFTLCHHDGFQKHTWFEQLSPAIKDQTASS